MSIGKEGIRSSFQKSLRNSPPFRGYKTWLLDPVPRRKQKPPKVIHSFRLLKSVANRSKSSGDNVNANALEANEKPKLFPKVVANLARKPNNPNVGEKTRNAW